MVNTTMCKHSVFKTWWKNHPTPSICISMCHHKHIMFSCYVMYGEIEFYTRNVARHQWCVRKISRDSTLNTKILFSFSIISQHQDGAVDTLYQGSHEHVNPASSITKLPMTWRRRGHDIGSHGVDLLVAEYSALLVLWAGNSATTCEFPSKRPVMRSFDVFFDLRLNKRLCKQ